MALLVHGNMVLRGSGLLSSLRRRGARGGRGMRRTRSPSRRRTVSGYVSAANRGGARRVAHHQAPYSAQKLQCQSESVIL
jgi:hypothetical protein